MCELSPKLLHFFSDFLKSSLTVKVGRAHHVEVGTVLEQNHRVVDANT